jgi:hypothetical protein
MYRSVSPSTGSSSGAYDGRYVSSNHGWVAAQSCRSPAWWAPRLSQMTVVGWWPSWWPSPSSTRMNCLVS